MPACGIRMAWKDKVGEPSDLIVELHIGVSQPGSIDSPCSVRGRIAVPEPPRTDGERHLLAQTLVDETVLPVLRPQWNLRILDMTIKRIRTLKRTIEVGAKGLLMPQFMWWEKEYVEKPYMRALPMKDLNQRFFDIMVNAYDITNGGKIGIRITASGVEWMRYFQHITTEARMRELPYPLFLDKRYSPNWDKDTLVSSVKGDHSARADKAVKQWRKTQDRDFHVVKYGEYQFMKMFLENGQIQISPSRTFNDEVYNRALHDDENSVIVFGTRTRDGAVMSAHDLPSWWGDRYTMFKFMSSMDRDYLLYCMAGTLSSTLFSHFGQDYDACVLIHDMAAFAHRLEEVTKECFSSAEFVHAGGPVTYVDPLGAIPATPSMPKRSSTPIPFLKHFRHAYQDEVRFVWVPREPRRGFEKTVISIGSLRDVAEIIRI